MPKTIAQIIAEAALAAVNATKNQSKEPYEGQSRAGSSSMQMQRDQRWSQYVRQKASQRQQRPSSPYANRGLTRDQQEWAASHPGQDSGEERQIEVKEPEKKLNWLGSFKPYGPTASQMDSSRVLGADKQREALKSSLRDLYSTRKGQTSPQNFDSSSPVEQQYRDMAGDKNIDYTIVRPDVIKDVSKRDSTVGQELARKYLNDFDNSITDIGRADHDSLFDLAYPDGIRVRDGKIVDKNESWVLSSARGTFEQGMLSNAMPALQALNAISNTSHAITTELGAAQQRQLIRDNPNKVDPLKLNLNEANQLDPATFDIGLLPVYYRSQADPSSVPAFQYKYVDEQIPDGRGGSTWRKTLTQVPTVLSPEADPVKNEIYQRIADRYRENMDFVHRASEVYTPSMWINEVLSLPSRASESIFSGLEGRPYNERYARTTILPNSYENSTLSARELISNVKKIEGMLGQPLDPTVVSELPRGLAKDVQDQLIEAMRANGSNPGREYFDDGLDWNSISRTLDLLGVPKSRQEEMADQLGYTVSDHKVVEQRVTTGMAGDRVTGSYTTFSVSNPDRRVTYDDVKNAGLSFMDANGDVVESDAVPDVLFETAMRGDLSRSRTNGFMDFVGDVLLDVTNYAPFSVVWKPVEKLFEGVIGAGKLVVKGAGALADVAISAPLKTANKIIGRELVKNVPDHLVTGVAKQLFTETVNSSALKFARRVFVATASILKPDDMFGDGANDFVNIRLPEIAEAARSGDKISLIIDHHVSPTAINNVIDTFRSTEKFLSDIAVEGEQGGAEEMARRAIMNRAAGYIKGSGDEIVEARKVVAQRLTDAMESGRYDDLVSAAHVIEDTLRGQADDTATAGGTLEIAAKLLNEGQIAYGNARLGVKGVVETAAAASINRVSGMVWGAWTNLVLTLRPGWQVVNYIDNTFRMLVNGDLIDLSGKTGGVLLSSSRAEEILSKRYGLSRADISDAIRRYYGDDAEKLLGILSDADGRIFDPVTTTALNALKRYAKATKEGGVKALGDELWKTLRSVQPRIEGGAAIKVFTREYARVFDPLFAQINKALPEGLIPSPDDIIKKFESIAWMSTEQKGYYAQRLIEERAVIQNNLKYLAKDMALNPGAYEDIASAVNMVVGTRATAMRSFLDSAMPAEMPQGDFAEAMRDFVLSHLDGVNWADDASVNQLRDLSATYANSLLGAEKVVKTAQKVIENPPPMSEFAEREMVNSKSVDVESVTRRANALADSSRAAQSNITEFQPDYKVRTVEQLSADAPSLKAQKGQYLDTKNTGYNTALESQYIGMNRKMLGHDPSRTGAMRDVLNRRLAEAPAEKREGVQRAIAAFDAWNESVKKSRPRPSGINAWQDAGLDLPYRQYIREVESRIGKPVEGFSWESEAEVRQYLKKYFAEKGQKFAGKGYADDLEAVERYAHARLQLLRLVDEQTPVLIKRSGEESFVSRALTPSDLSRRGTEIKFDYSFNGKKITFDTTKLRKNKNHDVLSTLEYIDDGYVQSGRSIFRATHGTWTPIIDVNSQTDQLVRLVKHDVLSSANHTPDLTRVPDEVEQLIDMVNVRSSVVQDARPVLDEMTGIANSAAADPVDLSEYVDLVAKQDEAIGGAPLPEVGAKLNAINTSPAARLDAETLHAQLLGVIKQNNLPITDEEAEQLYNFMVFTANANDLSSGWEIGTTLSRVSGVTGEKWGGEAVFQSADVPNIRTGWPTDEERAEAMAEALPRIKALGDKTSEEYKLWLAANPEAAEAIEKSVGTGTPLFNQSGDSFVLGYNQHVFSPDDIDAARSLIGLLRGGNADTAFEEWSHHLFKMQAGERKAVMYGWAKAPVDTTGELLSHWDVKKELRQLEMKPVLGAGEEARRSFLRSVEPQARRADEQLTLAFRKYVMVGIAPNSKLKEVFEQVKQILVRTWKSVKAFAGIKISPELRAAFDDMLGADPSFIASEMDRLMKANAYILGVLPTDLSDLRKIAEDTSTFDLNAGLSPVDIGGRIVSPKKVLRQNVASSFEPKIQAVINKLEELGKMYGGGEGILTGDYDEATQQFALAAQRRAEELRGLLDYAAKNNVHPAQAWRAGDYPSLGGKYPKLLSFQRELQALEKQRAAVSTMTEFGTKVMVDGKMKVKLDANTTSGLMDMVKKGDVDGLIKAYNNNLTLAAGKSAEKLESIRAALIAVYDRVLKGEDTFYDALTGKAIEPDKLAALKFLVGDDEAYHALSPVVDRAYLKAGVDNSGGSLDFSKFDPEKFIIDRPATLEDATAGIEDRIDRLYENIVSTKIEGYDFAPIPDYSATVRSGDWEALTEELGKTSDGKVILDRIETMSTVKQLKKLVDSVVTDPKKNRKLWDSIAEYLPRDRAAEVSDILAAVKDRLENRPSLVKIIDGFTKDLHDFAKAGNAAMPSFDTISETIDRALLTPGGMVPTGVLAQDATGKAATDSIPAWFDAMKANARSGRLPDISALQLLGANEQRQVMGWLTNLGKQVADASHIAKERAGQRVNDVLMDYNTTLGIDAFLTRGPTIQSGRLEGLEPVRILGGFVPFAKFPRMNMSYVIEQIKRRPQIVQWYQAYKDNINAQRRAEGLPEQDLPSVPVDVVGTSAEFNPMALLSGKMAVNAFTGYIPDYLSPSEKFVAQARNMGFSISPGTTSFLTLFGIIRPESASYFSLIPQGTLTSLVPGLPQRIEDQAPVISALLGVTSPGDSRGIIKQLGYNALAEIENAQEWNKREIAKQYIDAMSAQSGPKWDTATSDYYDNQGGARVLGYFTGSYPRTKTESQAQYEEYKADLANLRNALDGLGALDDNTRARLESMINDTPERAGQTIINVASPRDENGNLVLPDDKAIANAVNQASVQNEYNEKKARILADYFATHQVKVGLTQFDADWDAVTVRLNQLEADYVRKLPGYNYKPQNQADAQARMRANMLSLLSNSKPAYTGDYDKWKKDTEAWQNNLPEIADRLWKSLAPALKALGQPTDMPDYIKQAATQEEMRKFEARFYTLDRAMGEVWSKHYYDGYWDAVNGKVGKERMLAAREYMTAHAVPTDKEIHAWLESDIFKGRFSKTDVAARIKELGGVANIKDKLLQGKDYKSIQGDELSDLLSRIPPGKEFFRFKDSLTPEMQRYLDAYTVDNYKPLTDDQKWSDFYHTLQPLLDKKYPDPSTTLLKEWVAAEQLDKKLKTDRERRWPGIGELVTAYGPMSATERKAFRLEHPEIGAYYDWLYNEFAPGHELWNKYYGSTTDNAKGVTSSTTAYGKSTGRRYGGGGGRYYSSGYGSSYRSYSDGKEYQNEETHKTWLEFKSLLGDTLWGDLNNYWDAGGKLSEGADGLLRRLYAKYAFGAGSYEDWLNKVLPNLRSAMLPGHNWFSDPNYFKFNYQKTPFFSDQKYWFKNTH